MTIITATPANSAANPFELPAIQAHDFRGGRQCRFAFENRYGASVVRHSGSYGNREGLWELAVLYDDDNVGPARIDEWELCYGSSITDDVIGNMTIDDVNATLRKIGDLADAPEDRRNPWR
ncbi:MAG: hypothetical protein AAGA37_19885 [Actinomycetota bacterium]